MENPIQLIRVTGLKSLASAPSITRTLTRVHVRNVTAAKSTSRLEATNRANALSDLNNIGEVLELKLNRP